MRTAVLTLALAAMTSLALAGCDQGTKAPGHAPSASESAAAAKPAPVATVAAPETSAAAKNPVVEVKTSEGTIKIELWPDKAPATVQNFLTYVKEGFYEGTVFHRVNPTFMIQGGGYTAAMKEKATHGPVKNEARSDVPNVRGTIAMARTGQVDSATAQFFINVVHTESLDHTGNTPGEFGYCVFGQVLDGLDVVDRIAHVPTRVINPQWSMPLKPVVIESVKVIDAK
jgi:cyclophilin family peptidyl-prolyl cis-trans isomerase/predicted small lipoprotein YifL